MPCHDVALVANLTDFPPFTSIRSTGGREVRCAKLVANTSGLNASDAEGG